ncbi:MAG: universal stress protein [Bradymonadaceae bacterium]
MFGDDIQNLAVRRILVALDTMTESFRTLEAAADLAAILGTELVGLYIEDPALLKLEELQPSRKIELPQGLSGGIEKGSLQRELRASARHAQDVLARAAEHRRVEWNFEVVRGSVDSELATAAVEGDLLVVESRSGALESEIRRAPTAEAAVHEMPQSVLYLQHREGPTQSIVAVYDDTPQADAALNAALQLHGGPLSLLTVLLPTSSREVGAEWQQRAEQQMTHLGAPAHFRRVAPDDLEWLSRAVGNIHGDILIQSAESPFLREHSPGEVLDELDCPVLLVR